MPLIMDRKGAAASLADSSTHEDAGGAVYIDKDGKEVQKGDLAAVTKLSRADAEARGIVSAEANGEGGTEEDAAPAPAPAPAAPAKASRK